ncbi:transcription antitermination protein RfaH [bacterium BMS3Abin07]|nr:transcription antitermination protein RfaH [bacterium BMS3Abin07]GBE31754.1 transcription antitermination protein RfaH [bacterium BMS3Bbin05]
MNWYAIYTKPGAEDSTGRLLNKCAIEILNPGIVIKKYVRGKYSDIFEPLFPCYIFALFDAEIHGHMIKYTRGVRYIVGKENPLTVPPGIVDAIKKRMEGGIVRPEPEDLSHGDRVLINEGPFRDFYGIFKGKISGSERAMILLEALHCRMDIDARSIIKV